VRLSGGAARVTCGWAGFVARLRVKIIHIISLSCKLLGDIRVDGREGD